MKNHEQIKEEVIAKLEEKLANVKSGKTPVVIATANGDPLCPPGYYYDKETKSCIFDVG